MVKNQLRTFKKYEPLLRELVSRDLKTRYRRSVLGFLWTVLNPLGMMIILSIVFATIFRQGIENFPVYLMCGQLIFNFYSEASSGAMTSVLDNSSLLTKVYVPKYLFPLARVCSSTVNLLSSLVALLIVIVATRFQITWTIIFVIFPLFYVCVFAFGMGLILATVVVFFRDMKHLYGVLVTAWMYLTPIIYPMSMLPDNIAKVVGCNPLTVFVEMFRMAVMENTIPPLSMHVKSLIVCILVLVIGLLAFKKNQDKFILKF